MMNNIPRIFFSYWDGSPLTYLQLLTIKSFQELNPDWKVIIYMPEIMNSTITWNTNEQKDKIVHKNYLDDLYKLDIEIIKINFEDIGFYNDISEVHKSDYLRYYMLSKHGGVWSDMDVLYIKSFDEVFSKFKEANLVISYFDNHYSIGMLMSSQGNNFFLNLANNCKKYFDKTQYQCIGVGMIKALYPLPETINKKHPDINSLILESTYYLPYAWNRIDDIFANNKSNNIKSYTVGIHWFNGSSYSKNYQKMLENGTLPETGSIYVYLKKYLNSNTS